MEVAGAGASAVTAIGFGWPIWTVNERAVLMAQGPLVKPADLGLRSTRDGGGRLEDMSLEDVECFLIKKAMTRFDGNVSQAAKALGLSRSALYRRLQRYGL